MAAYGIVALVPAMFLVLAAPVYAQATACTSAPGIPEDVMVSLVPARDGAVPDAPRLPAVLEIEWTAPAGAREQSGNAPAVYVVEAGTQSGVSDVAEAETVGPETRYSVPLPNGTYYVRLRSMNDCGTSGASAEFEVPVTGSVPRREPNPFVLLDTVTAVRERLADTAFVRVMGQVRNGWEAAPASFIEVTAVFDGPAGEASEATSTYVDGGSRRLARSRLVTDTVLGPGATGCFVLFAIFPAFEITGVRFEVVADDRDVEPLEGQVEVDGVVQQQSDKLGDLMVSGRLVNLSEAATYFNETRIEVSNALGQVLDCDAAPVRGSDAVTPDGISTQTALAPSESANFDTGTEIVFAPGYRLRHWVTWDEADDRDPATATGRYRMLRDQLAATLDADEQLSSPQERSALRDALRREIRAIDDRTR